MRTQLLWASLVAMVVTGGVGVACSASGDKSGGDLTPGGPGDDSGGGGALDGFHLPDGGSDGFNLGEGGLDTSMPDFGADAFWADDPPPATCGDSGVTPKPPGGTPECPDDKNRQGCPCAKEGSTAACWPGLRKNRSKGVCKDGTTTCVKVGETTLGWGPCNGYVLPTGTTGKAACTCFSGGTWELANLSPCFIGSSPGTYSGAVSTLPNYDSTGKAAPQCPADGKKPTEDWTKTTLKVDCAGHFKLCYTLKAGDGKAPKPTDCVVTQQCAEGDYTVPNVVQPWGNLPAWEATDAACASQFASTGGYGEMSVDGTSIECDHVTKVFNTVSYCPLSCSTTPSDPACASCSSGGGGSF